MTTTPPARPVRPAAPDTPHLHLMHGGRVRFTIHAPGHDGAVQVWGPVTGQDFETGTGRVTSLRVSDARVYDGRLRTLMLELDELAASTRSTRYAAGLRKALDLLGALQPVDRGPTPAQPPAEQDLFGG